MEPSEIDYRLFFILEKLMKKTVHKIAAACLAMTALTNSANAASHGSELATHTGVYFEPKVMVTLGDTVSHGESTLDGGTGYGVGFDLGYSFTEYFALELDGTYSVANVKETLSTGESETADANFYTYGANAVLTYPVTTHFIVLGKLGYGYEHEDLGSLGITGTEHGATWAAGVEYSFMPHMEVSFEYEGADIRSARGDTLQLGLIYKF